MSPELGREHGNGDTAEVSPVSVSGSEGAAEPDNARKESQRSAPEAGSQEEDDREEGEVRSSGSSDVDNGDRAAEARGGEQENEATRGRKRVLPAAGKEPPSVRRAVAVSALPAPRFSSRLPPCRPTAPSSSKKFPDGHGDIDGGAHSGASHRKQDEASVVAAVSSPPPACGVTSALPKRTFSSSTLDLQPSAGLARSPVSALSAAKQEASICPRSSRYSREEETRVGGRHVRDGDRRTREDDRRRTDDDSRDGRDDRRTREDDRRRTDDDSRDGRDDRRTREDDRRRTDDDSRDGRDDRRTREDDRRRTDDDSRNGRDDRRTREDDRRHRDEARTEGREDRRGRENDRRGREEDRVRSDGKDEDREGSGGRERDSRSGRDTVGTKRGDSARQTKEDGEDEQDKSRPASWTSVLRAPERNSIRSLEDVLTKQKTEEQPTRIMFLTKKQREQQRAADERRQMEMEKKKERQLLQNRKNFLMQQEIEKEREMKEKLKQREMEKIKEEQERRLRAVRGHAGTSSRSKAEEEREAKREAEGKKGGSSGRARESSLADLRLLNLPEQELRARQQERELEQIRNHYLGMRTEKKKIQKPSEKFRNIFNFEWNDAEDTCKGDNNPLYQERMEPQLLFGRGFRAGMDIREQRKQNNFYDELVKRRQEHQKAEASRGAAEAAAAATEAVRAARDAQASRLREKEDAEDNRGHWTTKKREEMNERDWRIFREDFEIYIKGGRVPPPIRTWAESALPWELIEAVKHANYDRPTPIQMQAIPIALEQRDLIGIAETGSGKTAAFVLPMLTYVKGLPPLNEDTGQDGPYALILAPSRELALQIDEETQKFASFCKCQTVAVVGGRSAETQAFQLRRGAEIVIGTPGRVKDCLEKAYTVLNQCNYVVLDEADRMIDMGFEEIVNFILDQIPTSNLKSNDEALILQQEMQAKAGHRLYRLTQMFSATMPPAVERLARKYLRQPSYISIGDPGAGKRAIEQRVEFVPEARKKQRLQDVLENATPPVMVFVNQKKSADALAKVLGKLGYSACSLHGGKAQENREAALSSFKEGSHDVLVATDVAGRGIDVEGVQLVVNFDMPKDIEAYTHRIGRTGRAGRKGLAISFLTEEDSGIFYDLKQLLVSTNNIVPLELAHHPAAKAKGGDKNLIKPIWFN
ncbi:DEAD-family helicase [Toxoplasma gondii CAST]|uniref:RNA helicase n=1 Tax=Toxoplasma gondii CAST TaxID=943122 RepID=A0A3R7Z125_TOXGO|nr:DEAD-family helicase [Toxoplasma gondii CAST]